MVKMQAFKLGRVQIISSTDLLCRFEQVNLIQKSPHLQNSGCTELIQLSCIIYLKHFTWYLTYSIKYGNDDDVRSLTTVSLR